MYKAAIFDMDGLLIDSEPLWKEAEINIFSTVGLALTPDMCEQTTGIRIDAAVAHWYNKSPWSGKTCSEVADEIIIALTKLVEQKAKPMAGVKSILALMQAQGTRLAVCSSSPLALIEAVLNQFGFRTQFDVVYSADAEKYGKPHPAVYLATAKNLGVLPAECIAFEDSITGAIAAKAAGMITVAVPEANKFDDPGYDFCDLKLGSLTAFNGAHGQL